MKVRKHVKEIEMQDPTRVISIALPTKDWGEIAQAIYDMNEINYNCAMSNPLDPDQLEYSKELLRMYEHITNALKS